MYQLSHLLTEQRSLLSALASTSLLGENKVTNTPNIEDGSAELSPEQQSQQEEEERRRKLTAALEKVEGCVVSCISKDYFTTVACYDNGFYLFVPGCS